MSKKYNAQHANWTDDLSTHAERTLGGRELAVLVRGTIRGNAEESDGLLREGRSVVRTKRRVTGDHAEVVREGGNVLRGSIVVEKIVCENMQRMQGKCENWKLRTAW